MVVDGAAVESPGLDLVLVALANPHRRAFLELLGLQPHAIHQLAAHRGLSLPAINKHLKVLDDAGLIERHKRGRTTYVTLKARRLREVQDWLARFHTHWGGDTATHTNYDQHLGITPDAAGDRASNRRRRP